MTTLFATRRKVGEAGRVRQVGLVVVLLVIAAGLGFVAATLDVRSTQLALVACALPFLPILLLRPEIAAVAAVTILPFEDNLAPASLTLNVSASDMLLAITLIGLVYRYSTDDVARARLNDLRPLMPIVAVYAGVAVLITAAHPSLHTAVNLVQRLEVVGVPLLIGATLLTPRTAKIALRLFMVAALILAARVFLSPGADAFLGVQKNPAGQYLADAAFIAVVFVRRPAVRYSLVAILAAGVVTSSSRGALIGLLVGLAIYLAVTARDPVQILVRIVPATLLVLLTYSLLPHAAKDRLEGRSKTTRFNDHVRTEYAKDARASIAEHPILGVGIGNYIAGSQADLTQTTDPHDVVLLEAAEGGYVLVSAFVVLELGALVCVFRRRRQSPWVPAAMAVQAAILTHALVDVYWVRGTPVMGWLLIGIALSAGVRSDPRALAPRAARPLPQRAVVTERG